MGGFPIEKAKETMKLALDGLYPQDTFNLITFSGDEHILFPKPVPATRENLRKAQEFLASRSGSGGTEMMKAIRAALDPSDRQDHIRIACFMTDGYVGDDLEIIGEVQKHPNARVFAFGIGSSVNRFLLDKMAEHGRGEVEYVTLNDDGSAAARRLHERIRNPLLTDISIDWSGLPVADVYPKRIPDLFSAKPVVVSGRYTGSGRGTIKLRGRMSGRDFVRDIPVDLPENEPRHDVLATLWARTRIDDLMSQDYNGIQRGAPRADVSEAITQLGLEYRLMSQFTSFVAVEEMTVTDNGQPRRIEVPVEMPEGVSHEGLVGKDEREQFNQGYWLANKAQSQRTSAAGISNLPVNGRAAATETVTVVASVSSPQLTPQPKPRRTDRAKGGGGGGGARLGGGSGTGPGKSYNMGGGDPAPPRMLSPEEQKRQQLIAKLHPSLFAVVERLNSKNSAPTTESKFVRSGKAEIQIWLTDKSPETIAELKKLGFEVLLEPKTAKMVIGRLPIEKLAALAELKFVRYAAPMSSS